MNFEVFVHVANLKEADYYLQNVVIDLYKDVQPIYVNPFDDPLIWEGHSTIIDEILNTLTQENIEVGSVKGIICSFSGGGLYNGIMQGLEKYDLAYNIPVVAVETKGCDVLNLSLAANKPVQLDSITSIAKSLGSSVVSQKVFDNVIKYHSKSLVLNDSDALDTCFKYLDDFGTVLEPACGASVHTAYHYNVLEEALDQKLRPDDVIIIIACGGSCATFQDLERAKVQLGNK
ncbi:uncharacterized protein KNAG_0A01150 [Huiozyma naganishii CBS 8797]|uniref:L-serine ammonia-lyase n=1 Tax=Huiozyma naganishii (strain ATCC MYA-139 / BCRC 22969 / CBS 8797 / KCTC 17520 / NBRC 10181 / NCYC 3082 / Yp74L-3) TaxID=1071383 RepID=J7S1T1_HUIN7|nr:hypothetical protein KNAG_0A01150 [Kazachstania naganishii CBS 8797]CCK67804.1 hypothetical protein KNAG_0A01150 [Kazachstania naganishii CBS 8797]